MYVSVALFASVVLSAPSKDKTFLVLLSLSTWEEECDLSHFSPQKLGDPRGSVHYESLSVS